MNKNDMRDVILSQPEQIKHSLEANKDVRVNGDFDSIVLAGLGGSGHPGDLLNALQLTNVPLTVYRSYNLPRIYGKNPLVIASSYSGNTEETLSAYVAAQKNNYSILINTAGGTLAEWAQRDNVPWSKIDFPGMQPRHTLFASFVSLATALANSGLAQNISEELLKAANFISAEVPKLEEPAKQLATSLVNKVPVFTSSHALAFAAQNFKIQTNENAKTPAFWNIFPELNHNEMVGFSHPTSDYSGKFHVVMLRDLDDHPRIRARMEVTTELYRQWGVEVTPFDVKGENLVEKLFYTISFGLWTTYFLANNYSIDPVPVEGVENFKQRLKEVAGNLQ